MWQIAVYTKLAWWMKPKFAMTLSSRAHVVETLVLHFTRLLIRLLPCGSARSRCDRQMLDCRRHGGTSVLSVRKEHIIRVKFSI